MVHGGSWWFRVVLGGFWRFLVVLGGSWWFLVVHGGSWWYILVEYHTRTKGPSVTRMRDLKKNYIYLSQDFPELFKTLLSKAKHFVSGL